MSMEKRNTQLVVALKTKDRLDRFKVGHKEEIISKYKRSRHMATNSDAIDFLLDKWGE
jgi:hypothetical protein